MRHIFQIADDLLYCDSFLPIDSRMYLLLHQTQAVVVDPCVSVEVCDSLKAQGVCEVLILLTHEHFDHISGVNFFREHFSCRVLCSAACARALPQPRKNLSQYFSLLFCMKDEEVQNQVAKLEVPPFSCQADEVFQAETSFLWNRHLISMTETPGHSAGSVCITIDNQAVFTGDSLVSGTPVVTRLPGGSRQKYQHITLPFLESLEGDMRAFPGHGEPQQLKLLLEQEARYASQG